MIGLDTNVLARFIVRDDQAQAAAATKLLEARTKTDPALVPLVTLVELWWVLTKHYDFPKAQVADLVDKMLATEGLQLSEPDVVRGAVEKVRSGADFADAVIAALAMRSGCDAVATFDRKAIRRAGMRAVAELIR
ncbi:MAG: type II toxin-antitoxin system VapC family toxin [Bifidobacteriaceae bacterium]|nr:type II toxin-antitoxin system VapC family toxin [Bifidobacteriaceae bacterium]